MKKIFIFTAIIFLLLSITYSMSKDKYMIMAPHTAEECLQALDEMAASKSDVLSHFYWGCQAGDHTGYAIIEADSESDARGMLPASQQKSARIVKLDKFTKEQIESFHKK